MWKLTRQENVVEPEIPDGRKGFSVGDKGAERSRQGSTDTVIP